MKRQRHRLQVSTFPFLAVLLCAMGSLILLLLVIDRRAKVVAKAKALAAVARAAAEDEKEAARRQAEWDQRRRALHALLQEQEQETKAQGQKVRDQMKSAVEKTHAVQLRSEEVQKRLQAERARLVKGEAALNARRATATEQDQRSEASQAQLRRMAQELDQLERAIADLKALRQREQQTYSLVPYHGKHGDNRRPLYIECTGLGLVFHPDHQVMSGLRISPLDVRTEVEHRLVRWRAEGSDRKEVPYLLMLVRPDGIGNYYRTLTALEGLEIDFGYEFIDADWILDFPEDDRTPAAQPWMTQGNPDATRPATATSARQSAGRGTANSGVGPLPNGARGVGTAGPGGPVALLAPVPGQQPGSFAGNGVGTGLPGTGGSGPVGPRGFGVGGGPGTGSGGPGGSAAGGPGNGVLGGVGTTGAHDATAGSGGTAGGAAGAPGGQGGGPFGLPGSGPGNGLPGMIGGPGTRGVVYGSGGSPGTSGMNGALPGGGNGRSGSGAVPAAVGSGSGGIGVPAVAGIAGNGSGMPGAVGPVGSRGVVYGDGSPASGPGGVPGLAAGAPGSASGSPGVSSGGSRTPGAVAGGPGIGSGTAGSGGQSSAVLPGVSLKPGANGSGSPSFAPYGLGPDGKPLTPATATSDNHQTAANGSTSGSATPANGAAPSQTGSPGLVLPPMFPGQSPGGGSPDAAGNPDSGVGMSTGNSGAPSASGANPGGSSPPGAAGGADSTPAGTGEPRPAVSSPSQGGARQPGASGSASAVPGSGQPGGYGASGGSPSYGQGNSGEAGSGSPAGSALSRLALPDTALRKPTTRPAPVRPGRQFADLDWTIFIECTADSVVLLPGRQKIPLTSLPRHTSDANPLVDVVSKMIDRRQGYVPAGQPLYRPRICFLVRPEGLRTYYLAYPALEALHLPMTRQEVHAEDEAKP